MNFNFAKMAKIRENAKFNITKINPIKVINALPVMMVLINALPVMMVLVNAMLVKMVLINTI